MGRGTRMESSRGSKRLFGGRGTTSYWCQNSQSEPGYSGIIDDGTFCPGSGILGILKPNLESATPLLGFFSIESVFEGQREPQENPRKAQGDDEMSEWTLISGRQKRLTWDRLHTASDSSSFCGSYALFPPSFLPSPFYPCFLRGIVLHQYRICSSANSIFSLWESLTPIVPLKRQPFDRSGTSQ